MTSFNFPCILVYIDPGSGSLLLQLILASFLSVLTFSKKIKLFVSFYFKKISRKDINGN